MLNDLPEWKALEAHRRQTETTHLRDLFAADKGRFGNFSLKAGGIFLDYSKNPVDARTMNLLFDFARACRLEQWRDRMFSGVKINEAENRAVLHTALRRPAGDSVVVDGEDVMPFVHDVLGRMQKFSSAVRSGAHRGYSGKKITDIVNIGIGGSDLGPKMVCEALTHLNDGPRVHFVSNVDGTHLGQTLENLSPETTLFLIASKTFTTQETMANAETAKKWFLAQAGDPAAVSAHFAALSTNESAVKSFGIDTENMFAFRDWVGGRYSLWSAIGLSICMAAGFDNFRALLDGAHEMDRHFATAPLERNMPAILALLGVWQRNFCGSGAQAILPYCENLQYLPAWMQQLDMESNGKSVDKNGKPVTYATGPVIFGEAGTNGQHAFYQLIHQGTDIIPCDFIGVVEPPQKHGENHAMLMANMAAQSQALMQGRSRVQSGGDLQKTFEGNRPSNTILLDRLDPRHLGMLLALYEHKVFAQGVLWNINSFDQWGVELGKALTGAILAGKLPPDTDSSTMGLLEHMRFPRA